MSKDFTIHRVPFAHLYRDLSFEDFFRRYDPVRDGKVWVATYSFSHKNFDFWAKFKPNSVLFVNQKYEESAKAFLRRYPFFEVHSVAKLHSKVVFFEKSGVLLVGSENLFAPSSIFSEIMIETFVPEIDRAQVRQLLFGDLGGRLLFCKYGVKDIRLHRQGAQDEGMPFLPCNVEVDHWSLIASIVTFGPKGLQFPDPEFHHPDRVYHLCEYEIEGKLHYLAFNRGYGYCGDLDEKAFNWLVRNCEIIDYCEGGSGGIFPEYHFIQKDHVALRGYWLGPVRRHEQFAALKRDVKLVEITQMKIRSQEQF
jgi:hypothetical protein